MNGRIWLESVEKQGSKFHVEIPFPAAAAHLPPVLSNYSTNPRVRRALIADDNPVNLALLTRLFTAWGFEPFTATSASEAWDLFQQYLRPDALFNVAILDIDIFGAGGGLLLATRLQGSATPPSRVVLMLLETLDAESSKQCKRLGIATIMRPLRRQPLLQALGEERRVASIREPAPVLDGSGLLILLAEDNLVNQRLVCRILEKMGHSVVVADDGTVALAKMAQHQFDLVIMDMQMPLMDGIKTTQQIRLREKESGWHIPVMAITANAFDDDRRRCLEAGMDGFVAKPVTAQAMLAEMTRVLTLAVPPRNALAENASRYVR